MENFLDFIEKTLKYPELFEKFRAIITNKNTTEQELRSFFLREQVEISTDECAMILLNTKKDDVQAAGPY